jgi:hypothetical protein
LNKFEVNNLKRNLNKKKRSLKTYIVSIFLTMCCILLSGCGISGTVGQNSSKVSDEKDTRPLVVTTIFPYYDFVRQIAGDRVRLKMVVPAGMDSHSFEPTCRYDHHAAGRSDGLQRWRDGTVGGKSSSFPGYGEHESPYDDGLCRCTGRGDRGRNGR